MSATWQGHLSRAWGEPRFDLERDLAIIRTLRDESLRRGGGFDRSRILAMLSVNDAGVPKLRSLLPHLVAQVERAGYGMDLLLGLNQDAAAKDALDELERSGATVVDLFTHDTRKDRHGGDLVFGNRELDGSPYRIEDEARAGHRVFAVHQIVSPSGRGKSRMVKALTDAVLASIDAGSWVSPPALMLELDDDTRFLHDGSTERGDDLGRLVAELADRRLDAVGARWRATVFVRREGGGAPIDEPDLDAAVKDVYRYVDYSQAEWFRFMPGGGTIGDMALMIAARFCICHRYPGSRSDDVHRTMYVDKLGARWGISDRVYVLNDCRNSDDQILRWLRGIFGAQSRFGRESFGGLYKSLPRALGRMPSGNLSELIDVARASEDTLEEDASW